MNTTYLLVTLFLVLATVLFWYLSSKSYDVGTWVVASSLTIVSSSLFILSFILPIGNASSRFIPVSELTVELTPNRVIIITNKQEFTDKTASAVNLVKLGNLKGVNYTQPVNAWGVEINKPSIELMEKE